MTRKTRWSRGFWRPLTAIALVASFAAPFASAGDATAQETLPATAAAVPESAIVFHTSDLDRDGAQWQQTEALLARVGVPNALDLWETALLEEAERSGDFTEADLDALLGGELAIAVLPIAIEQFAAMAMAEMESDTNFRDATPMAGMDLEQLGVVAILQPSDADAAWAYVERQIADLAAEQSVSVAESTYGEAALIAVTPGEDAGQSGMDDDAAMDGMDDWMGSMGKHGAAGLVAAHAGEFIVVGMTETDVTGVVDVIDGTAGSLADAPGMQAVAAELPADTLSFTYVDGRGILDALDPEIIAMLQSVMMEVPVESLMSQAGVAISADAPGFRFDTVTILDDTADLSAIVVENDPAVAAAAEQAPAGTFAFQAGRIPASSFQGLPFALAQAVNASANDGPGEEMDPAMLFPTEEQMQEEIDTAAATLEFDPAADLFDLLGNEFIAFMSFPSLDFENFGVDAVAALSTTDPVALAETTRKIAAAIDRSDPSVDIAVRTVGEEMVYVATATDAEGLPGLEFGVVADRAVIGVGDGIEQLATPPADSLADDAQYQTVLGLLPGEFYQVGYVDIGQAIDPLMMLLVTFGMMDGVGAPDAAAATPTIAGGDPRNIRALGAVAFQQDNVMGASAILYIADDGS